MLISFLINVLLSISYTPELPGLGLTLETAETNIRGALKVNTGLVCLGQCLIANV